MKIEDIKPILQEIEERKTKEEKIFHRILVNYLKSFPAHRESIITIASIEPTFSGIYVTWNIQGTPQRYARTIKYDKMNELTKEFLQP